VTAMDLRKHLARGRARLVLWHERARSVVSGMVARVVVGAARNARWAARSARDGSRATGSLLAAWHGALMERGGTALCNGVQRWSGRITHEAAAARASLRHVVAPIAASARQRWTMLWQQVSGYIRAPLAGWAAWLRTGPLAPIVVLFDGWRLSRQPRVGRFRIEAATSLSRYVALAGVVLFAVLVALPAFAGRTLINDLIFLFTMLALAQYWNLLAGYAGLVSVGQQAFVGLGGYLLFALTVHAGLDPLVAIVLAGLIAVGLALPTAMIVFRLRGAYFAIGTWVMAEVYRLVFAQFRQLGGGTGTSLPPFVTNEVFGIEWVKAVFDVRTSAARDIITYWAALGLAAGTILIVYLVLRSRHGLALAAIRDSEVAAESVGVDNFKTKLRVYVVTAAGTGMVGALIYLQKARISPDAAFSVLDWTAYVIFIVVIGGIGTIEGPIVGVLVFYVLQTNLAHFGTWYLILLGLFGILIMLFAPKGIWGYLSERYAISVFPLRRRLIEDKPARTEGSDQAMFRG